MECTEWCKRTKLNVSSLLYCINGISKQIVTIKYRWGGRQNTRRRLPLFELLQTISLIWQCFFFRSLTSCLLLLNFWTLLLSALNLHDFATKKLDSWETQFKCGFKVWRRKTKTTPKESALDMWQLLWRRGSNAKGAHLMEKGELWARCARNTIFLVESETLGWFLSLWN